MFFRPILLRAARARAANASIQLYLDIAAATEAKTTTAVAKPGTRMPRMKRVFRRAAAVARRSTSSSDGRGVSDAANAMRAARSAGKDAARAVKAAVTRRSSAGEASGIESAERCSVESAGGRRQTPHLERLGSLTDASINAAFDEFDANHSGTALNHASAFSFASPQYHGRFSAFPHRPARRQGAKRRAASFGSGDKHPRGGPNATHFRHRRQWDDREGRILAHRPPPADYACRGRSGWRRVPRACTRLLPSRNPRSFTARRGCAAPPRKLFEIVLRW